MQVKNPIAADLANAISDAARAVVETIVDVVEDVAGVDLGIPSLNSDALEVVIMLRNAACILRDAFTSVVNGLSDTLGSMGSQNLLSTGCTLAIHPALAIHPVSLLAPAPP